MREKKCKGTRVLEYTAQYNECIFKRMCVMYRDKHGE
jgi:hypothetical protein